MWGKRRDMWDTPTPPSGTSAARTRIAGLGTKCPALVAEGVRWVHIGDRYSDIFSFLSLCREMQCDFLIRAAQDRCVDLFVELAERPLPPLSHHAERPIPPALHLFELVKVGLLKPPRRCRLLPARSARPARPTSRSRGNHCSCCHRAAKSPRVGIRWWCESSMCGSQNHPKGWKHWNRLDTIHYATATQLPH